MSASEMLTFTLNFPLMVGDLVPEDDEVWQFLLSLLEIVDIILSFEITEPLIEVLSHKITQHNKEYIRLFNDTLKPKFHNLVHYTHIIRMSGPLRLLWCFKFESNHRQFKIYSHNITSRKNICLTLSKIYQFQFTYRLLKESNFEYLSCEEKHIAQNSYKNLIITKLWSDNFKLLKKISFCGISIAENFFVAKFSNDLDIFFVLTIVVKQEDQIYLFCQKIGKVQYDPHYIAYEIDLSSLAEFSLIELSEIVGPPVSIINTSFGKKMLRLEESYNCNYP